LTDYISYLFSRNCRNCGR